MKQKRMIDDAHDEPYHQNNSKRSQTTQLKTQKTYVPGVIYCRIPYIPIFVPINIQQIHSKHRRSNERWQRQASTAKERGEATTRAELLTAVPPLLPIDVGKQQPAQQAASSGKQHTHSCALSPSLTVPTVVYYACPSASFQALNINARNIERGNLKPPCCCCFYCCCSRAGIECLWIRYVKGTLVRESIFSWICKRAQRASRSAGSSFEQPNAAHPRHAPAPVSSLRALGGGPSSCVFE